MTTAFAYKNVVFRWSNGDLALLNFDLAAVKGERVALLGPSGCGKTTALRLLAGLEKPSKGEIFREDGQNLGIVFQSPVLMPWKRVVDNVAMPLRMSGSSKEVARERARDLLKAVGLADYGEHWPNQLSGGMAMRVAIARALVTGPKLLLMDEPFAALDEQTRFKLNDLLLSLHDQIGFTLLFVTHSIFESVYLCDRVVVMSERPGTISGSTQVSASIERNETFRSSAHYLEACRTVSDLLRSGMNET